MLIIVCSYNALSDGSMFAFFKKLTCVFMSNFSDTIRLVCNCDISWSSTSQFWFTLFESCNPKLVNRKESRNVLFYLGIYECIYFGQVYTRKFSLVLWT